MNDRLEPLMHRRVMYTVTDQDGINTHLYIRMKKQKITLKFAQIFIFIFVTFFA